MAHRQTVRLQFGHHRSTTPFVGVDDDHRAFGARQTMLHGKVQCGHWTMASALQSDPMNTAKVLIDDVPPTRFKGDWKMGRQPIRDVF
jgi:hypothetical protein